jgi:hypothetical protein
MSGKESMLKRRRLVLPLGFILLLTAMALAGNTLGFDTSLSSEHVAVHVVIENRTNEQIGPFAISDNHNGEALHINQIESFAMADAYFRRSESWGESVITMTVKTGKDYLIVPYFENDLKGRVDIRVECVGRNGLSGKKRDLVSGYFSFEWHSWGVSNCE